MPELPEVETVCRGLRPIFAGNTIAKVEQRRPNLRFDFPTDFVSSLRGQRINNVERRAKYIQVFLDSDQVWLTHLGMSGRFIIHDETYESSPHDHVVVHLKSGERVYYRDPRRFGYMDVSTRSELPKHRFLRMLGAEPLEPEFNAEMLEKVFHGRNKPLKTALLDQTLIAGLGNIYVCEALFQARLSPWQKASTLNNTERVALVAVIQDVLHKAIKAGGSTLRDYAQVEGELGYFQHQFQVYGRTDEPCQECTQPIEQKKQGGRSTFYCGVCQRV
ncbi:MAG: bifunctional DNA-formamidopyrimidine glycosylase/DNA-(apurinic or apyrimidinic site) lyase [Pseudomonadota bacterium]